MYIILQRLSFESARVYIGEGCCVAVVRPGYGLASRKAATLDPTTAHTPHMFVSDLRITYLGQFCSFHLSEWSIESLTLSIRTKGFEN